MRFLHCGDLHLGKRVHEFSMIEEQAHALEQIAELAKAQADAVILAGDLYDQNVPTVEAVAMLDHFLTQLAEAKIPVLAVSGNHDSAGRLQFASRLLVKNQIYIQGALNQTGLSAEAYLRRIWLEDEWGPLCVTLLPYYRGERVKEILRQCPPEAETRQLLVAHQFVVGSGERLRCDSETVFVGGLDQIESELVADYDYVALGHLHQAQAVGRETIRYCGSPLPYSFSEANQIKSATIVELQEKGKVTWEEIPLRPLRRMRKIKGTIEQLTAPDVVAAENAEDYLHVTLTDETVYDAIGKLRAVYPNVMRIEFDHGKTKAEPIRAAVSQSAETPLPDLFESFFEKQNGRKMSQSQRQLCQTTWREE